MINQYIQYLVLTNFNSIKVQLERRAAKLLMALG